MEEANKKINEYLKLCTREVRVEKLVIANDDVAKGLLEVIAQNRVTKFVIGAAADKHYSAKMKELRSKTAKTVKEQAESSCKIWFVCKGSLICTREAGIERPSSQDPPRSIEPEQMRSLSLPPSQGAYPKLLADPIQEAFQHKSRSVDFGLHGNVVAALHPEEFSMTLNPDKGKFINTEEGASNPRIGTPRGSQSPDHLSFMVSDDKGLGSFDSSSWMTKDQETEEDGSCFSPTMQEYDEGLQHSPSHHQLGTSGTDDEMYAKLQLASLEAENLRREVFEESCRRLKTERDLNEAKQQVRQLENLYGREMRQKKQFEAEMARQKVDLEELRKERDELFEQFETVHEQLSATQYHLSSLRSECEQLRQERANALTFSEFSRSELQQGTRNFDNSLKIGEGGYGSVHRGFVRHTEVAIKMLNPQSMQGNAEFHQEIDVLSMVRHPNLVTLIGACPEACALVYEFLPNGSLEDHLSRKEGRLPPLAWQVRVRIAAEVCTALIFLHSHKPRGVIHGDLKPANILLDPNFVSKLGDFGICRHFTATTSHHYTEPKGTLAYIDPEFIASGLLTPQSDVYSFGVILLRLLTGKSAFGIIQQVQEAKEQERLLDVLDKSAGKWPLAQAQQLVEVALRCCENIGKNRPSLAGEAWPVLELSRKAAAAAAASSSSSSMRVRHSLSFAPVNS